MTEFVECVDCEFVLEAASGDAPEPRRWEQCPDCGAEKFQFVGR